MAMAPHCCETFCVHLEQTVLIPYQLSLGVGTETVFAWPPEVCIVEQSFACTEDVDGEDSFHSDLRSLIVMGWRYSLVCCVTEQWYVRHDFSL